MSGGESFFYYPIVSDHAIINQVIDEAQPGDTIILAGTTYALWGDITHDKRLVFVGTGFHQDSTTTSGRTTITTSLSGTEWNIQLGADRSEFHGLHFGNLTVRINGDQANSAVDSLRFVRCTLPNLALHYGQMPSQAIDCVVEQCVVGTFVMSQAGTTTIKNSFIAQPIIGGTTGAVVENCILFNVNQTSYNGGENNGLMYRSCIFTRLTGTNPYTVNQSSIFLNNRWVLEPGSSLSFGSNVFSETGNLAVNDLASAFANSANINYTAFNEDAHYNVAAGFLTAGYDGTQVGIYGGPGPVWKDGALPFNPHWNLLTAPGSTNNGVLPNVHLKATAQPN